MAKQFGTRNAAPDSRQQHVMLRQNSVRTTSALDYWDQLVTLHYGQREGICSHFREQTIEETGIREFLSTTVVFELWGERFDPPLGDLFERLP